MTPSNVSVRYDQLLESVLLGFIFYLCVIITYYFLNHDGILIGILPSSFDRAVGLLNFVFTIFFLVASAFNCIFLKFKDKLNGVVIVSVVDSFIFLLLIIFYFQYWGRWDWTYSLGIFNSFVLAIPFCICRVIFIKILPFERSKEFIKLYHISFIILLFIFLI